jgi:hypothetical protein
MQTPGPPKHSLSAEHFRHAFVVVAQMGVVPEHVLLSVHCTQAPVVAHAVRPENAEQSAVPVQPRHVFVAVAQIGFAPEQAAFVRHSTHAFVVVLQTLVAPVHLVALVAVHCTQAPVVAQAARAGSFKTAHSVSPTQAWHFSVVPQIGVAPEQVAAEVHCTQVFVVVSHAGVAPVHAVVAVVAVHCTHWPSARQAGSATFFVWHCRSAEHATQMFFVLSQIGAAAVVHWLSAVHATHLPDVESQTAVGAAHALAPADWQPTHTLPTQNALVGSVQSPLTPQVPAASMPRTSGPGRPSPALSTAPPSNAPTSVTSGASASPSATTIGPSAGVEASGETQVARTTSHVRPPVQSAFFSQ